MSTASRATIGGMTGNNSCGTRSIRYGIMRDNVLAIDAILADGTEARFGEVGHNLPLPIPSRKGEGIPPARGARDECASRLFRDLLALGRREAEHIAHAFPEVSRRVGGYLIDALVPATKPVNLATLLCGSEGTLAVSRRIELKLSPLPKNKALGICHFATFRKAMEAAQHIVKLGPVAVEVVDRTLIELARDIAMFRPVMESYVRGEPDALLLVEFAEDDQAENLRRLDRLDELMGDLGHPEQRGEGGGRRRPAGGVGGARLRPQHHDVDEEPRESPSPSSRTARCRSSIWPTTPSASPPSSRSTAPRAPGTRTPQRRLPARAPRAQPEAGERRQDHARHRRGGVRAWSRPTRARTRASTATVWCAPSSTRRCTARKTVRAVRGGEGPLRSRRPDEPRQDRARLAHGRPLAVPLQAGLPRAPMSKMALDWSAYPGAGGGFQGAVEMCNNNGECRKTSRAP